MNKDDEFTAHIEVDFYEAIAGWIHFRIKADDTIFEESFSHVFDPIIEFKNWLEALSTNVQQTSFSFDPEGNDIKFDIDRKSWLNDMFTISEPYDGGTTFIETAVDRKQLVSAFYNGILKLANSDEYDPYEWEIEYIKERLCNLLEISEDELITQMLDYNREQLKEFLFNADPTYTISYPDAKDKNEEFNQFLKSTAEDDKSFSDYGGIETPLEWDIPKDYDNWIPNKKKQFVLECLHKETSGFSGTKLSEFKSDIIENYLSEEYQKDK